MSAIGYFYTKLKGAARKELLIERINKIELTLNSAEGDEELKAKLMAKAEELKHLCP